MTCTIGVACLIIVSNACKCISSMFSSEGRGGNDEEYAMKIVSWDSICPYTRMSDDVLRTKNVCCSCLSDPMKIVTVFLFLWRTKKMAAYDRIASQACRIKQ